jgi:predicted transcriptional regulator of viral defense system
MKNKVVTEKAARLLRRLVDSGKDIFVYKDVASFLQESSQPRISEFLRELIQRELVMRLKGGLYAVIPYNIPASQYFPNWHVVAKHLIGNDEYYIGYYSALSIFELTTQPALTEQVVVRKKIKPSTKTIGKVRFQFIHKSNPKRFFGFKDKLVDKYYRVNYSDLEMTFIDCLEKPELCGGIVEIAKAMLLAMEKLDYKKLLKYAIKYEKQVVFKRLGFLLELLEIETPIIEDLLELRSVSYALLDTTLPKGGKMLSRWRIQINEEKESITMQLYT